jgi:hypothetical protein
MNALSLIEGSASRGMTALFVDLRNIGYLSLISDLGLNSERRAFAERYEAVTSFRPSWCYNT